MAKKQAVKLLLKKPCFHHNVSCDVEEFLMNIKWLFTITIALTIRSIFLHDVRVHVVAKVVTKIIDSLFTEEVIIKQEQ